MRKWFKTPTTTSKPSKEDKHKFKDSPVNCNIPRRKCSTTTTKPSSSLLKVAPLTTKKSLFSSFSKKNCTLLAGKSPKSTSSTLIFIPSPQWLPALPQSIISTPHLRIEHSHHCLNCQLLWVVSSLKSQQQSKISSPKPKSTTSFLSRNKKSALSWWKKSNSIKKTYSHFNRLSMIQSWKNKSTSTSSLSSGKNTVSTKSKKTRKSNTSKRKKTTNLSSPTKPSWNRTPN